MSERHYQALGLEPGASMEEIKKAYRARAKRVHPDVNDSPDAHEQFIRLNEAYDQLVYLKTGKSTAPRVQPAYTYNTYTDRPRSRADYDRERARAYAEARRKEWEEEQAFFRTEMAFLLAIIILIVMPVIAYLLFGGIGLFFAIMLLVVLSPVWWQPIRNRPKITAIGMVRAARSLAGHPVFQFCVLFPFNIYTFFKINMNTLFPWDSMMLLLGGSMLIGFIIAFARKLFAKGGWGVPIFGTMPAMVNLFFLINFVFSSNPAGEMYRFSREIVTHTHRGREVTSSTTKIYLENNKYDEYLGIRVFAMSEEMYAKSTIIYVIEDGLFGIRVLKDYEFL